MKKSIIIPAIVSSLRIAALPPFIYLYNTENTVACLVLLAFCAATDFFDGYLARKLKATSLFGAYFDAFTDFVLMAGIFSFFVVLGLYPFWMVLLMAISFVLFVVTSHYGKRMYDPVGRYLGSALYIGVVLTLAFPTQAIYDFVLYAFVAFFLVSLASRIISLKRKE
jgi:phosphatidylglycerophosphate synthase